MTLAKPRRRRKPRVAFNNSAFLKKAVDKAGGVSKVAEKMDTTKQVIWSWIHVLKRVPAERVSAFEEVVNQPRHLIRPDLYPISREA
jgi:DNA-binding transcriptional regulator YdaS (Cro superfamily)